jgi:hypothetical protein
MILEWGTTVAIFSAVNDPRMYEGVDSPETYKSTHANTPGWLGVPATQTLQTGHYNRTVAVGSASWREPTTRAENARAPPPPPHTPRTARPTPLPHSPTPQHPSHLGALPLWKRLQVAFEARSTVKKVQLLLRGRRKVGVRKQVGKQRRGAALLRPRDDDVRQAADAGAHAAPRHSSQCTAALWRKRGRDTRVGRRPLALRHRGNVLPRPQSTGPGARHAIITPGAAACTHHRRWRRCSCTLEVTDDGQKHAEGQRPPARHGRRREGDWYTNSPSLFAGKRGRAGWQ